MSDHRTTRRGAKSARSPESELERLWSEGHAPAIQSFVASQEALEIEGLLALLRVDQLRRWADGQRVEIGGYVRDFPALSAAPEALFELIYQEWLLREERGESPSIDEYTLAFPALGERLRMQIDVHRALARECGWEQLESPGIHEPATEADELPAAVPDDAPPHIPGYEILDELGRGGMGVVYRALQLQPRRMVALKMILAGRLATAQDRLRFQNEAQAVAGLDHPNIVPILELNQYGRLDYFSMRLIEGESLAERQARLRDDSRAVARLMIEIAGAVHHAHQRGVLHRDLKPANILLDEQNRPYVTDFGLAKRAQADSGLTQTGVVIGSPGFMAPEQACGDSSKVTTATDVYGLGAILYSLLTGRPPFDGGSAHETFDQVRNQTPFPPSRLNPRVPHPLEVICLKCLEKEPGRWYGSADAFSTDLKRWLAGEPITARPAHLWERAGLWARRRPTQAALVTALAAALLVGLVGTGVMWRRAEVSLRSARAAEAHERSARLRAQARFSLALSAIKDWYASVRDNLWLMEPDDHGSRRRILRQAGEYYKKLQVSLEDDPSPDAQAQLSAAYLELGWIILEADPEKSTTEAAAALDRAVSIGRQLVDAAPKDVARQMQLADTFQGRGLSERNAHRLDEAERSFTAARAILERLSGDPACRERALSKLTWALGNLAAIQNARGRPQDALPLHRRVLEVRERLRSESPGALPYACDHAWALLDIAITNQALGLNALAADSADRAVREFDDVLRRSPDDTGILYQQMRCLDFFATVLGTQKQSDAMVRASGRALEIGEALVARAQGDPVKLDWLAGQASLHSRRLWWAGDRRGSRRSRARAIELYQELARAYPGAVRFQVALARCLYVEARLALDDGAKAKALASSEQAVELRQALLRRSAGDESFRTNVAEGLLFHLVLLLQSGRRAEVPPLLDRAESLVASLAQPPATHQYNLACVLSLAGASDDSPARRDRAMAWLRKAVAGGFRDLRHMRADPDLVPLHARADFQMLIMDLSFPADPFRF